jgi:hypothetical protein
MIKRASVAFLLLSLCFGGVAQASSASQSSNDLTAMKESAIDAQGSNSSYDGNQNASDISKLSEASLPFLKNEGQIDSADALYYADTFAGRIFVTSHGLRYALKKVESTDLIDKDSQIDASANISVAVFDESFVGGADVIPKGAGKLDIPVSYFHGNDPSKWQKNTSAYNEVSIGEVWPGIETSFRAHGQNVEKIFTIAPHADPSQIRMRINGAAFELSNDGMLLVHTELGDAALTKPIAYQDIDGKRIDVPVAYYINQDSTYSFSLGSYDAQYPIVVDPLLASTYFGGSSTDQATYVTEDSSGNIYTTGLTFSTDFPGAVGTYDVTQNGGFDSFIVKFSNSLGSIVGATYLGGTTHEGFQGNKIAFDSSGNVITTGCTWSADFPVTLGAYDTSHNGGNCDIYVAKLSADLSTLIAATFVGGNGNDYITSVIVESGNTILANVNTASNNFPTTLGAYDTTYNGGSSDMALIRLSSDLSSLTHSTYLGGANGDHVFTPHNMLLDQSGNVVIVAGTSSADYPTTAGAYDRVINGPFDIVVSKLSIDLSTLVASTYIGGSGDDDFNNMQSISKDSTGNLYVVSNSNSTDFPIVGGGYQSTYGGGSADVVVAKFTSDLATLLASTYVGGAGYEFPFSALYASNDYLIIAGETFSGAGYPTTTGAYSTTLNGGDDAFLSKLSPDLTMLVASTYIGGTGSDNIRDIYEESSHNLVGVGAASAGYPTTSGAYSSTTNDMALVRFSPSLLFNDPPVVTIQSAGQGSGQDVNATVSIYDLEQAETSMTVEFSTNGTDYAPATLTDVTTQEGGVSVSGNTISGIDTDIDNEVTLSLVWKSSTQLDHTIDSSVYLRFRANDAYQNGSYAVSSPFTLNTVVNSGGSSGGSSSGPSAPSNPAPSTPPTPTIPEVEPVVHPLDSTIKDGSGTVYRIVSEQGQTIRRPYTSEASFLSYSFNSFSAVSDANVKDLALPVGSFIPPRDGAIICSNNTQDKGTCYIISESKKRGFTSLAAFTGLGYSFKHSYTGDVSFLSAGDLISSSSQRHPVGTLINNHGTLQIVAKEGLIGIPSMEVLSSWGYRESDQAPANKEDTGLSQTVILATRSSGIITLSY